MATDQGRTSNLNGLQLVANVEKKIVPQVGHTTFRPPFTPITIGTIVGREVDMEYMPTRKTPMHTWHEKNNAVFVDAGAPASTNTALFFSCHVCIGVFLVGMYSISTSLPTIVPIVIGVNGGLNVVCPTCGTIFFSTFATN